nr:neuroglobin-like [Biomphalaria glabrata]
MGILFSILCRPCQRCRRHHYQLSTYLTTRQIQLIQCTWSILKLDLITLGLTVFLHFFETEPDLKMLFPKMIRMNESNQLEWDVDREMLQKHAVTVMEGLGAAVETLHDSHLLNSVLIALGQTHEKRNIKPYMLKKMWPSLQHGLSTVLGKGYTKSVSRAWRRLYSYICLQMKIGMENPDLIVDIHDDLSES